MNLAALFGFLPAEWRAGLLRLAGHALVALAVYAAGYATAWLSARDAEALAAVRRALGAERIAHAVTEADLEATRRSRRLSDDLVAADRATAADLQQRIDAYETRLAALARPACRFDSGDVADLLHLRGDGPATGFGPAPTDPRPAGRPGPGAPATAGISDCRRYAARVTAAARLANERLIAGRKAWIDLQRSYSETPK
ncbi:hypothetical protein ABB55_00030 [Prosthecomicrobium hirschii]|uniref:Uncharacterized protein n=1 Tax=Prosthecodimorpha hirschii TaxID=665126 RepID=A0A0P6VVC6_9HYPH|nr:hypothetical protein [Prosthecomicrobium hirschii]KPL50816.1 hypothetical protein ABB55_00030 [Prosthecomicrobium hirschii]